MKGILLAVAIATTAASLAGLLLPGVMSLLFAPPALLYVIWAARAARNHRFSTWLALASTVVVAVAVGALGVSMARSTFGVGARSERVAAPVTVDAAGNVVAMPSEAPRAWQQMQVRIDRRERIHTSTLLAIALGAWVALALFAVERVRRRRTA